MCILKEGDRVGTHHFHNCYEVAALESISHANARSVVRKLIKTDLKCIKTLEDTILSEVQLRFFA